jgi:bisphosphoglycerate-independent phosphoglycerate mutase (AlkP superfamily)
LKNGGLSDLAPSLLSLLGISIPKEMTGSSLFITE